MGGLISHSDPGVVTVVKVKIGDTTVKLKLDEDGRPVNVSGSVCDVYRGRHRKDCYALKRYRTAIDGLNEEQLKHFQQEASNWQRLDHPYVLKLLGIAKDASGGMYLVSPWLERGSLWDYMRRTPSCDRLKYIHQTADALAYLHERGLIHGDVKAQNVLISGNDDALLSDFGLSKVVSSQTLAGLKNAAHFRFQAPELLELGESRTPKSDVYAFGMLIYQVLSGRLPFYDASSQTAIYNIVVQKRQRPPHDPMESSTGQPYTRLWDVAEKCWAAEPGDRPSMRHVLVDLPSTGADLRRRRSIAGERDPQATSGLVAPSGDQRSRTPDSPTGFSRPSAGNHAMTS
ncbi:hypothetical protein FRB99_000603 [Tulasnella sp. 403]|nr:hypothetical protein FRB99_000603 [Tulasnella sp. 403]